MLNPRKNQIVMEFKTYNFRKKYFHLCSKGTELDLLFHDDEEFRSGMNIVALAAFRVPVEILAFCLMDNHFHFVVRGEEDEMHSFTKEISLIYKTRRGKTEVSAPLEKIVWSYQLIAQADYLRNCIAYVLRNPCQAGYRYLFSTYRWSSARLYFCDPDKRIQLKNGLRVLGTYPVRERRKVLQSRIELPEDWLMTSTGIVWPGNYVAVNEVEQLFATPQEYLWTVLKTKDYRILQLELEAHHVGLSDLEVRSAAKMKCREWYGSDDILELHVEARMRLAEYLISKFGASDKQLVKILHLKFRQE